MKLPRDLTRRQVLATLGIAPALPALNAAASSHETIPFAPPEPLEPLVTWVNHSYHSDGCSSAVTRLWPEGTGYCGLCPRERCNSHSDVCVVGVEEYISIDDADRLSTIGRSWVKDMEATS